MQILINCWEFGQGVNEFIYTLTHIHYIIMYCLPLDIRLDAVNFILLGESMDNNGTAFLSQQVCCGQTNATGTPRD